VKLPIPLEFAPMEARLVDAIPRDAGWQYEPKWDGFRCLAFRDGTDIALQSKSGQPLARYFPEIVAALATLDAQRFVLDGEIVIPLGDALSFDDLLQRIHPAASRVTKLAREHPGTFLIFDLLVGDDGTSLVDVALRERRAELERFARRHIASDHPRLRLSPATEKTERVDDWYARVGGALDGVVAKRLDASYRSGERDAVVKVKVIRSADCIVGGYRLAERGDNLGSLLLGLYDDAGHLDYVGFTSGFNAIEKRAVLERLQAFHGDASFDGKIPGGPYARPDLYRRYDASAAVSLTAVLWVRCSYERRRSHRERCVGRSRRCSRRPGNDPARQD
jgi:ATP-dependent DNA ligase